MSKDKSETHAVRAGDNRTLTAKAPALPPGAFTSASLAEMETPEATAFMRRVYDAQVRGKLAAGKTYFTGVPESELEIVEGSARMHKEARDDCRWLLLFARQELARLHLPIPSGIASAYRSADEDGVAWRKSFRKHYKSTKAQREKLATGAHGDEAFRMLLKIMPGIKAPAGFSNHTQGRAVIASFLVHPSIHRKYFAFLRSCFGLDGELVARIERRRLTIWLCAQSTVWLGDPCLSARVGD